jgi:membrane-bound lytic murein transglycosylase A
VTKPCPVCPVCPPVKPAASEARYERTEWAGIPAWSATPMLPSLRAFIAGCSRAQSRRPWQGPCAEAKKTGPGGEAEARVFFETQFTAYRIVAPDGGDSGLITGYYEPVLNGRREPAPGFRQPVYAVPDDLIVVDLGETHPELRNLRLRGRVQGKRLVPYYSRSEIDVPSPTLPAKPLAWVADPIELFFLQIQGSGLIELASGERVRVGYADQNGHPYRSLGRVLIDRGELKQEQASMQGIKAWAAAHPEKLQEALNSNPSYVFFRELPPPTGPLDGPPGALGVPLTPGYSVAVDPRFISLGAPVFLATTYPLSSQPLERLVMAQDTGGAIRGAVRADFFWGTGEEAGAQAGRMRQQGKMWLLWPKGESPPRQQ